MGKYYDNHHHQQWHHYNHHHEQHYHFKHRCQRLLPSSLWSWSPMIPPYWRKWPLSLAKSRMVGISKWKEDTTRIREEKTRNKGKEEEKEDEEDEKKRSKEEDEDTKKTKEKTRKETRKKLENNKLVVLDQITYLNG